MSYYALYLKYRPLRFDEVGGQDPIVKTLKNALLGDKLAHAYLFSGPRGTGKTSMARLLAKAMNCDDGFGFECNKCDNCIEVIDGIHPDVIEIDAASNNGVDDIRSLIESVRYAPMKGEYKVYIIDEVHMMTPNAFNALLKTLEEPPAKVVFILATTEIHKVPQTIASRCQRFDFQRVSDKAIKERLEVVLAKENIQYDDKSLDLIVSLADGGMRDALSILDQVVNYTNNIINVPSILELYSLVNQNEKVDLLRNIFNGETALVIEKINYLIDRGAKIQTLTEDLNQMLKDLVIYNNLRNEKFLSTISNDEAVELISLTTTGHLLEMMDILTRSESEYRNIHNVRNLFEITILKMINVQVEVRGEKSLLARKSSPTLHEIEKNNTSPTSKSKAFSNNEEYNLLSGFTKTEESEKPRTISESTKSVKSEKVVQNEPIKKSSLANPIYQKAILESHLPENITKINDANLIKLLSNANKELKMTISNKWDSLLPLFSDSTIGVYAELLHDAHITVACKDILIVEFDYDYVINKFNDQLNRNIIKELMQRAFGVPYAIYGFSRIASANLIKHWRDLSQLGKLPKGDDAKYKLEEILKNAK